MVVVPAPSPAAPPTDEQLLAGATAGDRPALEELFRRYRQPAYRVAHRLLGALPDNKTAMLYSLSAMTSYGHANIALEPHWQMMGALEALNGMLLFGLTTAFLFAMITEVWPVGSRARPRRHP